MLQRHVIPYVATKWYELGAELFDEKEEHILGTIETNYSRDANKCCFEMFRSWLQTDTNATWSRIVEALESPGINLASVATDLRKLISKIAMLCLVLFNSVSLHCIHVHNDYTQYGTCSAWFLDSRI